MALLSRIQACMAVFNIDDKLRTVLYTINEETVKNSDSIIGVIFSNLNAYRWLYNRPDLRNSKEFEGVRILALILQDIQ